MRNLARNPNPQTPQGTTSNTGQVMGGGVAGVASKAEGHSVKVVNDQTDYSLWEFYYDPSKDQTPGAAGGVQATAGQATQNPSGFGQSGTNQSGFGSSSFGQSTSAFGQNPSGQNTAPSNAAATNASGTGANQPQ
jgi:hypothetical protein